MKVELHMHTSRYSGCARNGPQDMLAALVAEGYDAVFLTEHDAVWPDEEIAELQAAFGGVRIFPGVERGLGADSTQHLLILGTNDPAYLRMTDPAEILAAAKAAGHLTVLAHPIRWPKGADMLNEGHLPDGLEGCTGNQDPCRAGIAGNLAERLGLKLLNSDDAHSVEMVGRFWIETARPLEQAGDLRGIVLDGAYANHMRGNGWD
jgi:predicted metal-dependent phosphoesterase TrpH